MCLIAFAWHSHPDFPLILAANRDEFYTRRTRTAAWWGNAVSLLAGRDEEAGGTWLGITRSGRFAALTNVRAPSERNPHAPSRGELVLSGLQAPGSALHWITSTATRSSSYNGFNLLLGDIAPQRENARQPSALYYYSNRNDQPPSTLAPGVYGLSNSFLDTPWPKLTRTVGGFATLIANRIDHQALFELMANRHQVSDPRLPNTGVPLDWERALSSVQVRANAYGTRSTTLITVRRDGVVNFIERAFDVENPEHHFDRHYEFTIGSAARSGARLTAPDEI